MGSGYSRLCVLLVKLSVIRQALNVDDVHHFPLVKKLDVSELQTETRSTNYVFLAYRLHIHTQISDLITSRMYETFST